MDFHDVVHHHLIMVHLSHVYQLWVYSNHCVCIVITVCVYICKSIKVSCECMHWLCVCVCVYAIINHWLSKGDKTTDTVDISFQFIKVTHTPNSNNSWNGGYSY